MPGEMQADAKQPGETQAGAKRPDGPGAGPGAGPGPDVTGMVNDPAFNKLSLPQQKMALGNLDPEFSHLSDEQYRTFRQGLLLDQAKNKTKPPVVPGSYPSGFKPQDLTGKDILAAGVNALPVAGGFVGGLAGAVPGAAMGGAVGEVAKQALVSKVGQDKLSGDIFKVDPPPGSWQQATGQVGLAGMEQGAFEMGGSVAAKLLRGVFSGPMHAASKEYQNALVKEVNEQYGLNLTAQEVTNTARMTQRPWEYSIFSQSWIQHKWGQGAKRGIKAIDDLLGRIYAPTSPGETDATVRGMLKISNDLYKAEATNLYETQLKPAAQGISINMRGVKQAASDMLSKIEANKQAYQELGGLGSKGEKMLRNIVESPNDVPFETVHDMRSNLMDVSPDIDALMANKVQGAAKQLNKLTTDAIDTSLGAANPQVRDLWIASRDFYREGAELFQHEAIQGLMSRDPAGVAASIKAHDAAGVVRLRDAILKYPRQFGDPATRQDAELTWRQLQEQFSRSRILADPEHAGVAPDPKELAKISQRMAEIGPGVLNEIYGNTQAGQQALLHMTSIGKAFERIETLPTESRKYVYGAMAMLGSIGAYTHSGTTLLAAGGMEAVPIIIGGLLHSKAGTGYLLDGIGGLIKAAKNRPAQMLGKGVIRLQEKTITSDPSYRYLGKAMADLARAVAIYKSDRDKLDRARGDRGKEDGGKEEPGKIPPGAGHQQDHIQLMLNEWR